MIARAQVGHTAYVLSLKPGSCSVAVEQALVVAWDRGGRLYSVWREGHTFRRGLNGRVLEKWQDHGERHRRWASAVESDRLVDEVATLLRHLATAIQKGYLRWVEPPDPSLHDDLVTMLQRGAHFDSRAAARDARHFAQVYQPIGILPPDQYLALVLQATEGCSFNTCTFCHLFGQPFRAKTPHAFAEHVAAVRAYLGESIRLRKGSIFLGSANALAASTTRLVSWLECVEREFGPARPGVQAFVDGFTGSRKSADDYRTLAGLGLRRVYIGLESGHDPLLELVDKPGRSREAVETVQAVKSAGVDVAVIVMIGLGGERYATSHVADTVAALRAMQLGPHDFLYFSELVEDDGTPYPRFAASRGIRPLTRAECAAQRQDISQQLTTTGDAPRIASYDVREFVY